MITASSLARLRACPGSAVLPRAENHNEWADMGHEEHEDLSDLANLPDELAALVPPGSRPEVKLAFDVMTRTGRVIGEGSGRDYGTPGPFEIVGSTDVLGILDDAVVVLDWKTGFADVEPAASNSQLWFYALAACKALGKDRAIIRIVYTKTGRVDEAEAGPLELAEFASQLLWLHQRVTALRAAKGEPVSTKEGPHCKHCGSKPFCGAKNALLVQISSGGLAAIGDTAMTADRAAGAYQQINRIEQLIRDARKRLDVYVEEQGPIDLGDGRMYGRYKRKGNEKIDGAVAIKAIREVLGDAAPAFESAAIGHTTSKAAIDRAAKQVAASSPAKLAKAVIAKARELGGVSSSPSYPIGEYLRGKDEAADKPEVDTIEIDRLMQAAQ